MYPFQLTNIISMRQSSIFYIEKYQQSKSEETDRKEDMYWPIDLFIMNVTFDFIKNFMC